MHTKFWSEDLGVGGNGSEGKRWEDVGGLVSSGSG
jgi:hypothetical protein